MQSIFLLMLIVFSADLIMIHLIKPFAGDDFRVLSRKFEDCQ